MSEKKRDPRESGVQPGGPRLDRRGFVKAAGAAGFVGAVGPIAYGPSLPPESTAIPTFGPQEAEDFPRPEGLLPGGQLDSRFPVSFRDSVKQALNLMMDYYTALNERNAEGIADTLHFPFAINEDIEPLVYQNAREFVSNPAPTLNFTDRGLSRVGRGSYDILSGGDIHVYCPVGAVVSFSFQRYNAHGYKLGDYDCLLSVTNNDHRWGIQMVSSIFHEMSYGGIRYPFAAEGKIRESQGYLAAFGYRDEGTLNDRSIGRGSYEDRLPVGTRIASVSFGYGPRERTRDARAGTPMRGWVVSGVSSRLRVSTVEEFVPDPSYDTNLDEFVDLAGQTVGEYSYTRFPPERPVVIHATHDKAHVLSGYWRFTPEGELISETKGVGIRIYKGGVWGDAGSMGALSPHDRSNSKG